jgi:hypothetical protein
MSKSEDSVALGEVEKYVVAAARDLFSGQGIEATYVASGQRVPAIRGDGVAATIGFAADGVRGALVLLGERPTVRAFLPEEERCRQDGDDADLLCDLMGELSNMLLGRLKNQLLGRGVVLMLATPMAGIGAGLRILSPTSPESTWHEFATASGSAFVRFDATFEPGFALRAPQTTESAAVPEGDLMLF